MQPINFPAIDCSPFQETPEPEQQKRETDISSVVKTALQSAPQEKDFRFGLHRIRNFVEIHSRTTEQALANLPQALRKDEYKKLLIGRPYPKAIVVVWEHFLQMDIPDPLLLSVIAHPHTDRLCRLLAALRKYNLPIPENVIEALTQLPLTDSEYFKKLFSWCLIAHKMVPKLFEYPSLLQKAIKHEDPVNALHAYAFWIGHSPRSNRIPEMKELESKKPNETTRLLFSLRQNKATTPENIIRSFHYPEEAYRKYRDESWVPFYVWFSQLPTEAPCSP